MFCAYLEQNLINGKLYAGKGEWKVRHAQRVRASKLPNFYQYNYLIVKAYRKYGSDNFVPHTLVWFDTEDDAFSQEKKWIEELDLMSPDKGYNLTKGGEGQTGRVCSEESRKKMRDSHLGKKLEKPRNSRLLKEQVFEILRLLNEGELQTSIAKKFGIAQPTVSDIHIGRRWSNVTGIKKVGTLWHSTT